MTPHGAGPSAIAHEKRFAQPPATPRAEYRFVRVHPSAATGEWADPETGLTYQQVIESYAVQGWMFVQAVPVGLDGRGLDLVFERALQFRPLVIGHVPKTAGSSITSVICGYMQHVIGLPVASTLLYGHMIPYTDLRPIRQLPPFVRLVAGHFGRDHYQLLLRTDPFILVTLRDPFERLLSTLEHERRDAAACPADADVTTRERYERITSVIERITVGRTQEPVLRAALRDLRDDHVAAAEYLLYTGQSLPHAWIDSREIARLCRELAATADTPSETQGVLEGLSRINIFPAGLFRDFEAPDRARLRECFLDVFSDEVALIDGIRRETPSLFASDAWTTFMECLWRQRKTASVG